FFFFSSRRRHTRSDRDWSSDVCSSDLSSVRGGGGNPAVNTGWRAPAPVGSTQSENPGASVAVIRSALTMPCAVIQAFAWCTSARSEERRVGKECRSRWSREHEKEKQKS